MVTDPSAVPGPDHDADMAAETETEAEAARPVEPDAEAGPRPEPVAVGHEANPAAEAETPAMAEAVTGPGVPQGAAAPAGPVTGPGVPQGAVAPAGPVTEDRIVRVDLWATVVFAVVSVGAAVWSGLLVPAVAVDIGLFVAGCAAFLYAYLRGIGRSRDDVISLAGLFFLMDGVAPRRVARALWLLLAAQVVVAVATAAARPFSSLAFGILAPMFGLALLALWGAVHGRFPPRVAPAAPATPADSDDGEPHDAPTGDEA